MSLKQELHRLIDLLQEDDEESALDYLRWLLADEDTLTADERAATSTGACNVATRGVALRGSRSHER